MKKKGGGGRGEGYNVVQNNRRINTQYEKIA